LTETDFCDSISGAPVALNELYSGGVDAEGFSYPVFSPLPSMDVSFSPLFPLNALRQRTQILSQDPAQYGSPSATPGKGMPWILFRLSHAAYPLPELSWNFWVWRIVQSSFFSDPWKVRFQRPVGSGTFFFAYLPLACHRAIVFFLIPRWSTSDRSAGALGCPVANLVDRRLVPIQISHGTPPPFLFGTGFEHHVSAFPSSTGWARIGCSRRGAPLLLNQPPLPNFFSLLFSWSKLGDGISSNFFSAVRTLLFPCRFSSRVVVCDNCFLLYSGKSLSILSFFKVVPSSGYARTHDGNLSQRSITPLVPSTACSPLPLRRFIFFALANFFLT